MMGAASSTLTRLAGHTLGAEEIRSLRRIVAEIRGGVSPVDPEFYSVHAGAQELLPERLHAFLVGLRERADQAASLIAGFPVDDVAAGPTPKHWTRSEGYASTADSDIFTALCAMALGEPFCWATLQCGRMIQDVFPIRGDEERESGHGSSAFLTFHTDDAFRPDCCDYLLLFGVRNHDRVPTYVSSARDLRLSDRVREVLAQSRFHILPDDEHIRQLEIYAPNDPALARAVEMRDRPRPVPVLYGDPLRPRIRLDVPFMRCIDEEPESVQALAELGTELKRVRRPHVVKQGTLLVLDNRLAVHARESFTARYDGTDRWLRKLIVSTRRPAVAADGSPLGRVLL
jgi:L-asparagine oxygenase